MAEVKMLGRVRKLAEGLDAVSVGKEDEQITLTQQSEQLFALLVARRPTRKIAPLGE